MKHTSPLPRYLSLSALSLALAACGGGSGTPLASNTLTGALIDGPIAGATVFVDLNNNQVQDDGEPTSSTTLEDGSFSIDVSGLSAEVLASASLVSIVPDTAKDADDNGLTLAEAGRSGSTYISPLSAYVSDAAQDLKHTVLSPLTTMVSGAITSDGLTLTEAKARIRTELQLGEGKDPMAHYIKLGDAEMARKARASADAMGEAKKLLHSTLTDAGESMGAAEANLTISGAVRDQMAKAMADATTAANIVGSRLKPSELMDALNTAGTQQAIARKVGGLAETMLEALRRRGGARAQPISSGPQTFTVVFADAVTDADTEQSALISTHGGTAVASYRHMFKGFTVTLPNSTAANAFLAAVSNNPKVQLVEGQTQFRRHAARAVDVSTQWGLDMLDGEIDGTYTHTVDGSGATVFVVDTGVQSDHAEFATSASDPSTRVLAGINTLNADASSTDDNGHGTHVAGTIAGLNVGVSAGAAIVPVKVLDQDGAGSLSSVLSGLDWVAGTVAGDAMLTKHAAVNLSLGGGASAVLDLAAAKLVDQGIPVIAAAGNNNANACDFSPAREPKVITVGAVAFNGNTSAGPIGNQYTRAYYSNFGPCVDVYAPGSVIRSAELNGSTTDLSGTSMATPHVSGWVAQLLQLANADSNLQASFTAADVQQWVVDSSARDKLVDAGPGSANRLLQVAAAIPDAVTAPPAPTDPVVTTEVSVSDIQGQAIRRGAFWQAAATIIVTDGNGVIVPSAQVSGRFTVGEVSANATCITAANGSCTVGSSLLPISVSSLDFSPTDITGSNLHYNADANAVTRVTISAPAAGGLGGGKSERKGHPRFSRERD